ncbi:MAG: 2-amino-4-hydroxy-6-hydroxymethyldihydropteridine diphosphokinase [Flavobacteriaceae bacterium]|jgi:deoxyguanosine kinase|nr:2-amino-4-hydroxy-6-hydroxymethyldihydropteridine diphosphokinase [Formosa sp.]MDG1374304.1 2-amino-4-hydroxy-6-hydroxymethyldihydropteridine diphosphokinase [Flavobacteriaceae bacterium]MDG2498321.1 2-amino-4-hydroxy-6-hydroxymethyldihydropteridine diphosphokinase [Flavobacteriaceae bacterium]
MTHEKTVLIGIGSNTGDKTTLLQSAIDAIHTQIGSIDQISRLYQTPALGFEGADFINGCLKVTTQLEASQVLEKLLIIEQNLGRTRHDDGLYHSRTIDLDLLFFDSLISKSERLELPHPRLHNRRFVLQPLTDIASDFEHPVLKHTISTLLEICNDESIVTPLVDQLTNPMQAFDFSKYNFIAIEGNIGAGKTSLAHMISHDFNAKKILERFADNPFLPKFYEDATRYAFTLEMSFLADRYQQISDDLSQLDLFKDFIVSDYDVFKSLIFSKITLSEDEFVLYRKLFYQVYKDIARPDLYIYLYQNTERLQENIRLRGRDYEKTIESSYLEKINSGYLEFIKNHPEFNVKIIDISNRDFIKNRVDYLWILEQICA